MKKQLIALAITALAAGGALAQATDAVRKGANAIVNIRFSTSSVAQGAAEIYVYGTAVYVVD